MKSPQLTKEEESMQFLHPLKLKVFVVNCSVKLTTDLCYPEKLRMNFENSTLSNEEAYQLWSKLHYVTDSFNENAEAFYSKFYGLFQENLLPTIFEDRSVTNTLMIEVANDILHHLFAKSSDMSSVCALEDNLSGNEIKSCFQNLSFTKIQTQISVSSVLLFCFLAKLMKTQHKHTSMCEIVVVCGN